MEHTIGMRIPLILAFLILTLVPLLVQVRFTSGYFYQSHVEERMAEAQNRSLILANKIRSSDYINVLLSGNPNPALDAELSTTADLMNGRIVLVDDSFKILKDTFGLSRGKTLVVSDVLKAFDGETSSYLNQKKKYFYVAQPIQAKSTDAAPIDSDVAAGKGKNTAGVQGVLLLMASTENSALLQEKIVQKTGFLQLVMFCFILIADLLAAACLLKPFRRLQQQLDMVAEGNLDQDIDVKAYRETRDISEAVMQTIRKLKNLDQSRQEFVSNVSHELKTPIALIQGYAEGLTAGVADDPEDRKFYCDTIADEADHMNKLVMQLLSLSRLELGAEQTFDEDIDLHALCAEAVRKTAVLCENRGLTVEYDNTHITVRTDGDLLDQVLMNYLSNAIRYTPEGKHIEISAARTGNSVRLSVFNEGEGLPEEELPKIWEKFYRTDRARTREAGGTGIGLSLVRAIADTLHGACGAENVEGGICFWFELPDLLPAEDSEIKD